MKKYLVGICAFNEGGKIKAVLAKFSDYGLYDVLLIDDGSTDSSITSLSRDLPIKVVVNQRNMGAGYATRQVIDYACENGYSAVFFVSGNDKDDPKDINILKDAIEQGYDFVQGSRYLSGGKHGGMPVYRKIATRMVHPTLFSVITGVEVTDSTNGFRAIKTSLLQDKRILLNQKWLDKYELEPYLFYKAIRLGYKVKEVPVTKIYPDRSLGYTKMKPVVGWWSILRPLIYLPLGIKK